MKPQDSKIFKVERSGKIGENLTILQDRATIAFALQKLLIMKLRADRFKCAHGAYAGGLSAVYYPKGFKVQSFMKMIPSGGYMPDLKNVEGRQIQKAISELPTVSNREFNSAVCFNGQGLFNISVHFSNKEHFLFKINKEALELKQVTYVPPRDCVEISEKEYLNLIK